MKPTIDKVRDLFDRTDLYLRKDFDISTRSLIVRDLLGHVTHSRILDVGCGDGRLSLQFLSETNRIVLVDLSDAMLDIARKNTATPFRKNVEYINSDLHEYEITQPFDIVLCIGVLAHVVSVENTIAKVSALLKAGGRCVFQITDNDNMIGRLFNDYYRLREVLIGRRSYLLNRTGLSTITSLARLNSLTLIGKRRYLPPPPGVGKMPNKWLFKYQLLTLRQDVISKFGSEMLLLYEKE